jgi:hypothetical protein
MKAILEYDLSDSDDRMAHLRAVKSTDMALALWQILYNTRKEMLYTIEALEMKEGAEDISAYAAIELYRQKLGEIAEEYGINVDELIQ